MLNVGPAVADIAHTIQLVVAPVFMLAGIGGIMNVMAGRLQRAVDRSRLLAGLHGASIGPEHDRHVWELRIIDRRIRMASGAIALSVGSAIAICLVVALMFIASLAQLKAGVAVAVIFSLSMLMLTAGLILFVLEIKLSLRSIRVPVELLELLEHGGH